MSTLAEIAEAVRARADQKTQTVEIVLIERNPLTGLPLEIHAAKHDRLNRGSEAGR